MKGVLCRYGEIGIKSPPVRRQMEQRLRQNLEDALLRRRVEGHVALRGPRLWMTGPDQDALLDAALHTFGIVSASRMTQTKPTMEAIQAVAEESALTQPWTRFAVRATRTGAHDFSSQDLGIQVGSAVYKAAEAAGRTPQVDLDHPELEVFIEVRDDAAFVGLEKQEGPGGLPVGSQGRVVALLSDRASAVAAWLMMRRGCKVVALHAGDTGSAPLELLGPLTQWGLGHDVELLPVCTATVAKRTLLEAARAVAEDRKADALVTGDGLSSKLESLEGIAVLRPVCGLDAKTFESFAARIPLPALDTDSIFDDGSKETVESLLEMRRTVTI